MANDKGFTLVKWNGKEGEKARFIVRDESNGKMSYFTPDETNNLTWTDKDLTKDPSAAEWQDFGDEHVDELEDVIF